MEIRIDVPLMLPLSSRQSEDEGGSGSTSSSSLSRVESWDGGDLTTELASRWDETGSPTDHMHHLLGWSPPPLSPHRSPSAQQPSHDAGDHSGRLSAGDHADGGHVSATGSYADGTMAPALAPMTHSGSDEGSASRSWRRGSVRRRSATPEPVRLRLPHSPSTAIDAPSPRSRESSHSRHRSRSQSSTRDPSPFARQPRAASTGPQTPSPRPKSATVLSRETPEALAPPMQSNEDESDGGYSPDGGWSADDADMPGATAVSTDTPRTHTRTTIPMLQLLPSVGAVDYHAAWYAGEPGLRLQRRLFPSPTSGTPMLRLHAPSPYARERLYLGNPTSDPDPRTDRAMRTRAAAAAAAPGAATDPPTRGHAVHPHVAGLRRLPGDTDDSEPDSADPAKPVISDLRRQWIEISKKFEERVPNRVVRDPVVFDRSWRTAAAAPPPAGEGEATTITDNTEENDDAAIAPRTTITIDSIDQRVEPAGQRSALSVPEALDLMRARRTLLADVERDLTAARNDARDLERQQGPMAEQGVSAAEQQSDASRLRSLEQTVARLQALLHPSEHSTDAAPTALSVGSSSGAFVASPEDSRGDVGRTHGSHSSGVASDAAKQAAAARRWRTVLTVVGVTVAAPHEHVDAALAKLHDRRRATHCLDPYPLDDNHSISSVSDNENEHHDDPHTRSRHTASGAEHRVTFPESPSIEDQGDACDRSLLALEAELADH